MSRAVRDTDGQGHGGNEVQPPACKLQTGQNHHSFHLAHQPGRKGLSWLDSNKGKKKKKMFPNCWVKLQVGENEKDEAQASSSESMFSLCLPVA